MRFRSCYLAWRLHLPAALRGEERATSRWLRPKMIFVRTLLRLSGLCGWAQEHNCLEWQQQSPPFVSHNETSVCAFSPRSRKIQEIDKWRGAKLDVLYSGESVSRFPVILAPLEPVGGVCRAVCGVARGEMRVRARGGHILGCDRARSHWPERQNVQALCVCVCWPPWRTAGLKVVNAPFSFFFFF